MIDIYTDGACKGNPGPGGWSACIYYKTHEKVLSGAEPLTTNNRMELTAAIKGLEALTRPCEINLYSDSKYLQQGITQWCFNWKKKGWLTAKKTLVKNVDLWQILDKLNQYHQINWQWIKGHSGNVGNELADKVANQAIERLLKAC